MEQSKQSYLQDVLETYRMAHIEDYITKYKVRRDEVKELIEEEYHINIYSPINSGSFAKSTAINSKFDLDLVVPFKRESFETLETMFDTLYSFLAESYADIATVRKQKVSIGIEFYPDYEGDIISLDIVPGREYKQYQYDIDKNLNLYIHSDYGVLEEKSYIKTNIHAQVEHIKAKETERKIIRLLKIWKTTNHQEYKSFLLELLTIKAFEKKSIEGNLWDKLQAVLVYIKDNVAKPGFRLLDPGNSGNNVMDTLLAFEKEQLSQTMNLILQHIESNEDTLKLYFPLNSDFKEEVSNEGYGLKTTSATISTPPDNTRFG